MLLQSCGEWDEAVKVGEKSDRINLKATHFRFARHHEALQDFAAATKHYQLSDTHRWVPTTYCRWAAPLCTAQGV